MDRRTFVATAGLALTGGLGGCVSESDGPGDTGDGESTTPSSTRTTSDGRPSESPTGSPVEGVVVDRIAVRKAVPYESSMGSGGVLAEEGRQYVVARVRGDRDLVADAFAFAAGDESWSPGLDGTTGAINRSVAGREGGPVGRGLGRHGSYLAFAVPSPLDASEPRITYSGPGADEWPLPAAARERLAAPAPRFELRDLSLPDRVSQGEDLPVSLSVANVSETDGRFLAAVYWPTELVADDDESRVVERQVPAGETASASLSIDTRYTTNEDGPVTLSVRGHVDADRQVRVVDASTPD